MKNKFCVVTGSRAEYGLLRPLLRLIQQDENCELQIIATGAHMSSEFGLTYKEIENDGFNINAKLEILLASDTKIGVATSLGIAIPGLAEYFERMSPDLIILLGDRYEILAAAQAAMIMQIPVAHLAGGDNGNGTYDNLIRHCITKMSSLHFVTHEASRRRVIQLGEDPNSVFCYGATAVDNILGMQFLSKRELEFDLGISFKSKVLLVTYHPLTMDVNDAEVPLKELFAALDVFLQKGDFTVLFTGANADNGGRHINQLITDYVKGKADCLFRDSFGQHRYLSAVKLATAVVGNSSSGIYEAPYLKTPTVNIGPRQLGRAAPASVINCAPNKDEIADAILAAMAFKFDGVEMLYGSGNAAEKIFLKLKEVVGAPGLTVKAFHDLQVAQ